MNILALDLGTKTGWAITGSGLPIMSGMQEFKPVRFDGAGMRYLKFARWLDDLTGNRKIDWLVFEEVSSHGKGGVIAAHVYGGFMATLQQWCEVNSVPYQGVPVGTIKKFWTGKGNSGKDVMIKSAKERGYTATDDNEVDAIALLNWAKDEADNSRTKNWRSAAPVVARRMAKR